MILTLEVTGSQADRLGAARRKTFNATGGTIGRLRDNYWSLPDPYVSSRHAIIRYKTGAFYIEDTSTNGVFINRADNRLVKGQPYELKDNDLILIEPYEIRATIDAPVADAPPTFASDPFAFPNSKAPSLPPQGSDFPELVATNDELDPLKLLGGGSEPTRRKSEPVPSVTDLHRGSPLDQHYRPPAVIPPEPERPASPAGGLIPDDYDPFAPTPPSQIRPVDPALSPGAPSARPDSPRPRPSSSVRQPPARTRDALAEVLRGAGIDPAAMTPEFAEDFGRILRLVVGGVMDVLQARQRIKSEFRMDLTTFRPADNNPLKFSANVDDALHNLLVKRNAAYLKPVDAFEDAFDDIRNHQVAMLAGMRVAFEAMLSQFDPDRLQEDFDRQFKRGALIAVPAKLRYWDQYAARFRDMVKDADAAFRELFGDEFAAAYEEQLKRLKSRSRDNNDQ